MGPPWKVTMRDVPDDLDIAPPSVALREFPHESTLAATIESTDDGSVECTLYPCTADGMDLMSQWITARDEAFVRLREVR